jgi:molecular chaperone Hsp33
MIQAPLGEAAERRLAALPPDGATVFTLGGGRVRGAVLAGTRMLQSMRANHGLGPLETLVLGRAYLCAGLLSTTIKGGDRLAVRVDGNGPAEGFSVEAAADGSVRGRLFRSPIEVEPSDAALEELPLFGAGTLSVTRFIEDRPRPFVGTVELETGRLASNLAAYYLESEQTRTAFDVGIEFDREGEVLGAGALYFQALPGADEEFLARVEDSLPGLPRIGAHFASGGTREGFLERNLRELFPEVRGEKAVAFSCSCSRERFGSFLRFSSVEFLSDLAENGPWPLETVCHNCASAYRFERAELEAMLAARRKEERR